MESPISTSPSVSFAAVGFVPLIRCFFIAIGITLFLSLRFVIIAVVISFDTFVFVSDILFAFISICRLLSRVRIILEQVLLLVQSFLQRFERIICSRDSIFVDIGRVTRLFTMASETSRVVSVGGYARVFRLPTRTITLRGTAT